jgi:copper(I)-binding protein
VDLSITSKQPAVLIGFSSEVCRVAELHRMFQEDGMMKMREVKALELPAGKPVNLGARGYHLMLVGLKAPLKAGEKIPLTLTIKLAENRMVKVSAVAEVRPLTATKVPSHQGEHERMRMD